MFKFNSVSSAMQAQHPLCSQSYLSLLSKREGSLYSKALLSWLRARSIATTSKIDVSGSYPFTPVSKDLSREAIVESLLQQEVVSLVLVTDASREPGPWLGGVFDWARPYKMHYVRERGLGSLVSSTNHRYKIKRARKRCETRVISLDHHLDEWIQLYQTLLSRHNLEGGFHDFSREYFEYLAGLSDCIALGAFVDERLVSAHLWLVHGNRASSLLTASSERGYEEGAAYAVNAYALDEFRDLEQIDFGGVADHGASQGGLAQFKKGFSNEVRPSWICGMIVDSEEFDKLCVRAAVNPQSVSYFPPYRAPGSLLLNSEATLVK